MPLEYQSFNFIHIPKCGGTSFRSLLSTTAKENEVPIDQCYIVGFNGIPNEKNITQLSTKELKEVRKLEYRVIAGHHQYGQLAALAVEMKPDIFHYTILRDPVSRFISHYNFFHFKLNYHDCGGIPINDLEEDRFIKYVKLYANLQIRYLAKIKKPKKYGSSNLMKIAHYNLIHEFGAFGILELPEQSRQVLSNTAPSWLRFNDDLPRYNENKMSYEIKDDYLQILVKENEADIIFYNRAVDHFKRSMIKQFSG